MKNRAFMLIELLVVVLIIGILAAIALPQYQTAVEKSRLTEAMVIMRAIRDAQLRYYLANGTYAGQTKIADLDITIPGTVATMSSTRIETKYFVYGPNNSVGTALAIAYRVNTAGLDNPTKSAYGLEIYKSNPDKIFCTVYNDATNAQKKLCQEINSRGTW